MVVSFCALTPCPSKKNDVINAVAAVFKENVLMVCLCFARLYQIYCQSFLGSLVGSKLILPPLHSIGGLLTFPTDFGLASRKKSTRNIRRVPKALVQSVLSELGKAPRQGVNYKQLSARLGIKDDKGRQKVQAALEQLLSEGRIKSGHPGRFELITFDQQLIGRVDMTQSGAAYVVVPEQEGDIYISPKD